MRRRTIRHLVIALLRSAAVAVLCGLPPAQPLLAQEVPARSASFNFQDADLAFVLSALAQSAGMGFSYSDLPQKPVTLRATLTRDEMLSLIRSLADANGVAVVQAGNMLRLQGTGSISQEDPRQLYIHRLRHARAPVLGATLQALFSGTGAVPRTTGAQTLTQQLRELSVQQQTQARQQQPAQIVVGGNILSPFGVVIVPDDATNALLVRASPADWQVMQQAIQALDLRPLQVVIEVVIAEVRRDQDTNIGVSISADNTRTGRSTTGTLPTSRDTDGDFTLRFVRTGDVNIEATLSALAATGDVRILSRPVIQAQNNQEARILVGTQRPFIQVSRSLPTTEPVRDEVVQYRDVATTLTILPTINEDGYVNMAITQEVNNATNEVQFGAPIISTREAVTQLLARDGQTVVIGGLIDRQTDRMRSGVPLLKDIPVLGALFGTTRETVGNSEMFLFLTPHIVGADEDADRIREEIEQNTDLLRHFTPIRPLIPPTPRVLQRIPPDTIPPDTVPPATVPPAAAGPASPHPADVLRPLRS
jgi:type II secretory pathway component GspD/PulD (secretin)